MRQITEKITRAFENREPLTIDNSRTDGQCLWLFNNLIAEWHCNGLWISNAGWNSKTTKERLNGLTGVNIRQQGDIWFLNGRAWNGRWVNVDAWNDGIEHQTEEDFQPEHEFDVTSEWMESGYSQPIYSVFHTFNESALGEVEQTLNSQGVPTKRMESDTDGVYKPNYFIVVRPDDIKNAIQILSNIYLLS